MEQTRRTLEDQLDELRTDLQNLANGVISQTKLATNALLASDLSLADQVFTQYDELMDLVREVERESFELFALQQPMAHDLREIFAGLRILGSLELCVGQMKNVARATRRLFPVELSPAVSGIIEKMGSQAAKQLSVAMGSFANHDAAAARALADIDDVMDGLQKELFRAIFESGVSDDPALQSAVAVAFIGRHYERAADHAVTIGDWVQFIETGELPAKSSLAG